jgi:hypothetical protein
MASKEMPFILAGPVTQQDLVDAGIPATILQGPGGRKIEMLPGSDADDFTAAQELVASLQGMAMPPGVHLERAALTDAWLTTKACLEALPAAPGEGEDPYAGPRLRLTEAVALAEAKMNNAGGAS